MIETYCLKIDLKALCARLSAAEGREVTNGYAFEWLLVRNFKLGRPGWYASPPAVEHLCESEILKIERIL